MPIIELAQHRHPIRSPGRQDHHMHDLMAGPKDIKPPRIPPLRKLHPPQLAYNPIVPITTKNPLTLAAYAPAPMVFSTSVATIHRSAIRSACTAHPYLASPCTTGMKVVMASEPNVAARSGRRCGSLKRGWKVTTEQSRAKAEVRHQ